MRVGMKLKCAFLSFVIYRDSGLLYRYSRPALGATMQQCLLECLGDSRCENVLVEYVDIVWMEQPPPLRCTLLGAIESPATGCQPGTGTLIKKLIGGRPGV